MYLPSIRVNKMRYNSKAVNTGRQIQQVASLSYFIKYHLLFLVLLIAPFFITNIYAQGNCPVCHGTGICQTCHGTGIMGYRSFYHGTVQQALGCTSCGGWNGAYYNAGGRLGNGRCRNCGGTGNVVVEGPPPPTEEEIKAVEEANRKAAAAAEAIRAKEAAERKRREDEEKFQAEKIGVLNRMKGGTGSKLGLKDDSRLGLKDSDEAAFGLKSESGGRKKLYGLQDAKNMVRVSPISAKNQKYLWDADHIVVPPPSWEGMLEQQVDQLRIGQNGSKYLMLLNDMLVTAFDIQVSPTNPQQVALVAGFKVLLIAAKSTIAAQQEAEVIVFRQNANFERILYLLKDKSKGAEFVAALQSIKENKAPPAGVSNEIMNLARLSQNREQGCSDVHFVMGAMLSIEAKAAFFETAKMEGIETLNAGLRGMIGTSVENRIKAFRFNNEQIEIGEEYIAHNRTANPWMTAQYQIRVNRMEKQMKPIEAVHEGISGFIEAYEKYSRNGKKRE